MARERKGEFKCRKQELGKMKYRKPWTKRDGRIYLRGCAKEVEDNMNVEISNSNV